MPAISSGPYIMAGLAHECHGLYRLAVWYGHLYRHWLGAIEDGCGQIKLLPLSVWFKFSSYSRFNSV